MPRERVVETVAAVIQKVCDTGKDFEISLTTKPSSLMNNWARIGVAIKGAAKKSSIISIPSI